MGIAIAVRSVDISAYGLVLYHEPWGEGIGQPEYLRGSRGRYPFVVRSRDDGAFDLVGGCYLWFCSTGVPIKIDPEAKEINPGTQHQY
ncbi:hypothetical protein BDV34DRAFT_22854 [Aspergillus parasiticus]|uniref:Uncharacterized protein n=1 Tax=Aspergillus parasiticus TaxID=5067 RepID=A0A5N6D583_ASPPA|nr:hypothetical protein BDV34DRAFT_22854 [Aspergillus parasiticus]